MPIRRITGDDWRVLRELRLAALQESPLSFGATHGAESGMPEAFWKERAAANAAGETAYGVFALGDGPAPAGLAAGVSDRDEPGIVWVVGVWVHPAYRRRGHARAMILDVLASARRRGNREARLHAARNAEPLYLSLGFAPTGRTQPLPHDPSRLEKEMRLVL